MNPWAVFAFSLLSSWISVASDTGVDNSNKRIPMVGIEIMNELKTGYRLVVISQGADAKNFDEKGSFLEQMGTQNTAEQNSEL
jgi:hypothetical protein